MVQTPIAKKKSCEGLLHRNPSKGFEMYKREENGTHSRAILFDNSCPDFVCLNNEVGSISV
jgi:hypothetical protein